MKQIPLTASRPTLWELKFCEGEHFAKLTTPKQVALKLVLIHGKKNVIQYPNHVEYVI